MKRMLRNQSDLSAASAIFYFSGSLFSVLILTVFHSDTARNRPVLIALAVASFIIGVLFVYFGRRVRTDLALVLVCLAATAVLTTVLFTPLELRAMNSGLLFYTFLIYLVWFGPMWLARGFGYTWLLAYSTVVIVRFSEDLRPYLVTLMVTAVVLGELIGRFKRRLETTSLTDPLCGVWNKRAFEAGLLRSVATATRNGRPLSLMYLDLDGLKEANDDHGHAEGDRILRQFAREIEAGIRPQDLFARLGGDEFALLLRETPVAEAVLAGNRLRESATSISWSFGVAELMPGEDAAAFLARADALMYEEKLRRRRSEQ